VATKAPEPPLYRKWWLWTAVGAAVAVIVVGAAVGGAPPRDAAIPQTALGNTMVPFK
jgi:hypothetical protein